MDISEFPVFQNSQLLQQRDFCGEHLAGNLAVTSFTNIDPGFPGEGAVLGKIWQALNNNNNNNNNHYY